MSIATAHTRLRSPLDALDRLGPFRSAIPLVVGILAWGGLYCGTAGFPPTHSLPPTGVSGISLLDVAAQRLSVVSHSRCPCHRSCRRDRPSSRSPCRRREWSATLRSTLGS